MKLFLVAVDNSETTLLVRDTARDLATRLGAKLIFFRSVGLPTHIDESEAAHPKEPLADALRHDAERELNQLAASCAPVLERTMVAIGIPWEAICTAAKDTNADLVIIGSHDHGAVARLLGTTAAKVVNHCDRSVLVVRPTGKA